MRPLHETGPGARPPTAIREALVNLESVPSLPAKWMVLAWWPGVMLHEAVGHGLEGDFNRSRLRLQG